MKLTKIYMGKGKDETEMSVPESIAPAVLTVIRSSPSCLYWVASLLFFLSSGLFLAVRLKVYALKYETPKIESSIECRSPNKTCVNAVGGGGK